jgi:hypothetical protein
MPQEPYQIALQHHKGGKPCRKPLEQHGRVILEIILCQAQTAADPTAGAGVVRVALQPADRGYAPLPVCINAIVEEHGLTNIKIAQVRRREGELD